MNTLSGRRKLAARQILRSSQRFLYHEGTKDTKTQDKKLRIFVSFVSLWFFGLVAGTSADEKTRFFETEIRPLLVEKCVRCHGAKKQSSELRVDSRNRLLKGGDGGPAIVPGDAAASRVVQAVRHVGDLEMPPDEMLAESQIDAIIAWIELGAPWPVDQVPAHELKHEVRDRHWAFQPVRVPAIPDPEDGDWARTPIDRFVLRKLNQSGFTPSPKADRRTLIRRASYAVTGLPPSADEVNEFVHDSEPHCYERLVDRLLNSKHYGEQWARHWLDVARYSDTKGYVYAREERHWVHAWTYRDWVIDALNEDLPYDRFLLLQLAADQVDDRHNDDLAAMGFLTLGRRFLGVNRDIIDDRIDVVTRGTLGLTVSCARCHDHKYDPIPTADYYSLYGVFDSCAERLVPIENTSDDHADFWKELQTRRDTLEARREKARQESSQRTRDRVGDYLQAQTELEKYPADGFDQIFQKTDLLPAFVFRWEQFLYEQGREDPVFMPWHAYKSIPRDSFASDAADVAASLRSDVDRINPIVAGVFTTAPASFDEVVERYASIFGAIDRRWKVTVKAATTNGDEIPTGFGDPAGEQLRAVLYGPDAPCEVPDEPIVHSEELFDSDTCTELWKLQGEVDRWIINSDVPARFALTLIDRKTPTRPRIFERGNPLRLGEEVPRRFLSLLAAFSGERFDQGSGRLELAKNIVDPRNPLTARVIVNRVWARYFGRGLVATPSDFGIRAGQPSHPELLDWLASQFILEGWSLKKLHRQILLSATFRQSSDGPADSQMQRRAQLEDPDNRWLWRMPNRRLSFEEFRDSLLVASDVLDRTAGGKPQTLFTEPYMQRRTMYGKVDRQFLPSTLRTFDFANPDLHIAQRSETTVPQQALFLMNHPLVLQRAKQLAAATQGKTPDETVRALFQRTLQRDPTDAELVDATQLIRAAEEVESAPNPEQQLTAWEQLAHILVCTNEFLFVD
jgi:hypothetical protein